LSLIHLRLVGVDLCLLHIQPRVDVLDAGLCGRDLCLAEGRLVSLLDKSVLPVTEGFFLFYPSRRQNSAALRAFIDFLRLDSKIQRTRVLVHDPEEPVRDLIRSENQSSEIKDDARV
jgi:hypothetical protein